MSRIVQFIRNGKEAFDLLTSEYRKMYLGGEWFGWHALLNDWRGKEWVLKHLCSWYKGDLDDIFERCMKSGP